MFSDPIRGEPQKDLNMHGLQFRFLDADWATIHVSLFEKKNKLKGAGPWRPMAKGEECAGRESHALVGSIVASSLSSGRNRRI